MSINFILKKTIINIGVLISIFLSLTTWAESNLEEAHLFCETIESQMKQNDDSLLSESLSLNLFLARIQRFQPNEEILEKCKEAFSSVRTSFGSKILSQIGEDGHFRLLRIYNKDNELHAVFRQVGVQGINYYDFILEKHNKVWKFADVYIYTTASLLTETIYQAILLSHGPDHLSRLFKLDGNIDEQREFNEYLKLFIQKKYDQMFDAFSQLPKSLQKEKFVLMAYLTAAQLQGDKAYITAAETYHTFRPNDPNLDLILIDLYLTKRKYDKALECINMLDKRIGGDPYLNVLRGAIYMATKNYTSAVQKYKEALAKEPLLIEPYEGLMFAYLKIKNFKELVDIVIDFEKMSGQSLNPSFFEEDPDFIEFVKSNSYQRWKASKQ